MNNFKQIGERIMKQTMVQINGAISINSDAGFGRVGTNLPSSTTIIRAVAPKGHEGHVMPMSPKPPAAKPANEKTQPKAPPPPVAKPPAKKAKSCVRTERGRSGIWYASTQSARSGPTSPRI